MAAVCRWEDVGPVYLQAMDALHQVPPPLIARQAYCSCEPRACSARCSVSPYIIREAHCKRTAGGVQLPPI